MENDSINNNVNNNANNNNVTRSIGEGTFSLGSAPKFGHISIKIDVNDLEKTKTAILKVKELYNWLALQSEVNSALAM